MKIFLINPAFGDDVSVGSSRSIRFVLNVIPPLGLAYCAAALEKNGFAVEIFDCAVEKGSVLQRLVEVRPRIIGITATTPVFDNARRLCRRIKELLPDTVIVLGGAHVTASAQEALQDSVFDVGVIGEGEDTIVELAAHIFAHGLEKVESIPGIMRMNGSTLVFGAPRARIRDLDSLPYPARHLLAPLERYHPTPASYRRLPLGIIISSRGCPQRCTFCDRAVFGTEYRARSAQNVLGEVEELVVRYGAREIRFFDDCFALHKDRVHALCAGFRKMKIKIPWTCLTTVASVDKELLREMKTAGCWQVLFGLESGDEHMLKLLHKGATLRQNSEAVRLAAQAGLRVRADFIIGTPGETEESLLRTLAFALSEPLDYAHFNKFVPYPGTELFAQLRAQGVRVDFSKGASITAHSDFGYIAPSIRDKKFYKDFVNNAHRKFYLRFSYIMKRFCSIRSWDELVGQIKGFLAILLLRRSHVTG